MLPEENESDHNEIEKIRDEIAKSAPTTERLIIK